MLNWDGSIQKVMLKTREREMVMVLMQDCVNHSCMVQEKQEAPQGGLQNQWWGYKR